MNIVLDRITSSKERKWSEKGEVFSSCGGVGECFNAGAAYAIARIFGCLRVRRDNRCKQSLFMDPTSPPSSLNKNCEQSSKNSGKS